MSIYKKYFKELKELKDFFGYIPLRAYPRPAHGYIKTSRGWVRNPKINKGNLKMTVTNGRVRRVRMSKKQRIRIRNFRDVLLESVGQ